MDYKRKIEDHLQSNNNRQVWLGVQHITNYRTNTGPVAGDASLAEELNHYFARFEVETSEASGPHPESDHSTFRVGEHEVKGTLPHLTGRHLALMASQGGC